MLGLAANQATASASRISDSTRLSRTSEVYSSACLTVGFARHTHQSSARTRWLGASSVERNIAWAVYLPSINSPNFTISGPFAQIRFFGCGIGEKRPQGGKG